MSENHLKAATSTTETTSTSDSCAGPSTTAARAVPIAAGSIRKRARCNSDSNPNPKDMEQRPPLKMYKGEETDTDNDMEGLMYSSSSTSSTPTVFQAQNPGSILSVQRQRIYDRDEKYYFEDGSCVLLVDDVLFNVHRSMLSRDSSSFSTMFSLPQGRNEIEGRSDDNPIILTGESPDEFRHFLWALYALPPELSVVSSTNANLVQLIDIARVSHKYSFKSLETWALDAIQEYVNRNPSPILSAIPPPHSYTFDSDHQSKAPRQQKIETADQLTRLIRLAQLCQHERLLGTMIGLLRQLMTSSVQYAYLAMKLSDELDLRTLRGAAYLEVMQKAVVVKKIRVDVLKQDTDNSEDDQTEGSVDRSGRLVITRAQQLRLLAGYYRLTSTWDKLRISPLQFEHSHSCGATWHQQGCTQSWLEFWKEKTKSDSVMNLGLADVLGRLKMVQKDYDRWGSATYMHHDCRINAKRAIGDLIKRVEEALPDYFAEPGDSDDS